MCLLLSCLKNERKRWSYFQEIPAGKPNFLNHVNKVVGIKRFALPNWDIMRLLSIMKKLLIAVYDRKAPILNT